MNKNIRIILSGLAILLLAVCCSKVNEEEPNLTPKNITLTAVAPVAIQSSN
jgi:outer membrane biogenesis lipoprotein LolB